jgi:hypothetical protein
LGIKYNRRRAFLFFVAGYSVAGRPGLRRMSAAAARCRRKRVKKASQPRRSAVDIYNKVRFLMKLNIPVPFARVSDSFGGEIAKSVRPFYRLNGLAAGVDNFS